MTCNRVFNESVFHSYSNLKNFFESSDAIKKVLSKKEKQFVKILHPINSDLPFIWNACQIATAPFRHVLAIVLRAIGYFTSCLGLTDLKKSLNRCASHLEIGFNTCGDTHLYRIVNSRNRPNTEGKIVDTHPSIPHSRITDPKVIKRTFGLIDKKIQFNHKKGICRGMSLWLLYLYLKTKNQFKDPRTQMASIGEQFVNGGGIDATLLHSLRPRKGKLLDLKFGTQPISYKNEPAIPLTEYTPDQWLSDPKGVIKTLKSLPEGAFNLHLIRHNVCYIKINEELGYFFDPNDGITEINGKEQAKNLYKLTTQSLKETGTTPPEETLLAIMNQAHLTLHQAMELYAIQIYPVTLRNQERQSV